MEISEIKKSPDGYINNIEIIERIIEHYNQTGDKEILKKVNPNSLDYFKIKRLLSS